MMLLFLHPAQLRLQHISAQCLSVWCKGLFGAPVFLWLQSVVSGKTDLQDESPQRQLSDEGRNMDFNAHFRLR